MSRRQGPHVFVDLANVRDGDPIEFHRSLPGYAPTPLWDVPTLAERLGVGRILVKDESERLGLPAFKMLGASWATARAIQREWMPDLSDLSVDALRQRLLSGEGRRRLAAATDGNHGRGVARMARMLGLDCTIYVPSGTAQARVADIVGEGATVTVVNGTYDDAIARSTLDQSDVTLVISDTSWEGYEDTPTDVIVGYSTMFREVDAVLAASGVSDPEMVLFQSGVGSFAASGLRHYARPNRATRPITVIVEPTRANCLQRSAAIGGLSEAPGPHTSTMAGLNCGLPSMLAWPVIAAAADAFVSIGDSWAHEGMALLAQAGIIAGESGAASLGALLATVDDEVARAQLGLNSDSTILLVNTEYATDPGNFERRVGSSPDELAQHAAEARRSSGTTAL